MSNPSKSILIIKRTDNDVIYGRGNHIKSFPGNIHYRSLVDELRPYYVNFAMSQKRIVSRLVYNAILSLNPPGRFLAELNDGSCIELPTEEAIRKISQRFREKQPAIKAVSSVDTINQKLDEVELATKIEEMKTILNNLSRNQGGGGGVVSQQIHQDQAHSQASSHLESSSSCRTSQQSVLKLRHSLSTSSSSSYTSTVQYNEALAFFFQVNQEEGEGVVVVVEEEEDDDDEEEEMDNVHVQQYIETSRLLHHPIDHIESPTAIVLFSEEEKQEEEEVDTEEARKLDRDLSKMSLEGISIVLSVCSSDPVISSPSDVSVSGELIQDCMFRVDVASLPDSNMHDLDALMASSVHAKKKLEGERGGQGFEREGSNLSMDSNLGLNRGWSIKSWESMASEDMKQGVIERGLSLRSCESRE